MRWSGTAPLLLQRPHLRIRKMIPMVEKILLAIEAMSEVDEMAAAADKHGYPPSSFS